MKVILLADVKTVGHEGDVVEVADGHARNYLVPQGLATPASRVTRKQLEQRRGAIEQREVEKRHASQEVGEELRGRTIVVEVSVGEGGRLHGQVTAQQIAVAVAEQCGLEVDRRDIDIPVPIRETGDYLVSAVLYKDVTVELPIEVGPAGTRELRAAEAAREDEATPQVDPGSQQADAVEPVATDQ